MPHVLMQVDTQCRLTHAEFDTCRAASANTRRLKSVRNAVIVAIQSAARSATVRAILLTCHSKAPCRLPRHAGCHKFAVDRAEDATKVSTSCRVAPVEYSLARKEKSTQRRSHQNVSTCCSGAPCRLTRPAGCHPRCRVIRSSFYASGTTSPCRHTQS